MATILPMSQDALDRISINRQTSSPSRVTYPALDQIASAALANVASTSSDSSQSPQYAQSIRPTLAASGSSNGSQNSWATDDTSPKSAQSAVRKARDAQGQRPYTPERQIDGVQTSASLGLAESPPLKQGSKRTASGAVKATSNGNISADLGQNGITHGRVRAKSSARAVEISSQLKTRLAYAMVKVNNGWENNTLDQLEHISRIPTPSTSSPSSTSPRRRRFSAHSDYNDRYITSPATQYSPNQQYSSRFTQQPSNAQYSPTIVDYSTPAFVTSTNGPTLAPAAPIAPGRSHRRSLSSRAPPILTTTQGYAPSSDLYSQPTTPRRQGILRMPSQQAEKDALDSLLFMASPNNSSNLKYTDSPAGPSPLRTEFPAAVKRVVFEG